jgi:predicted TIM-barrel fold metal-dependent hydrolase
MFGARFEDLRRGGRDPEARLADQERDGVGAEVIYPTVGMLLCNHPDFDYKQACFDAYNLWIAEYCAAHPERLLGIAFQVKDLCNIRRLLWANDFPHSDSTWPRSQELLARHAAHLTEDELNLVLHDNVAELYGLTPG